MNLLIRLFVAFDKYNCIEILRWGSLTRQQTNIILSLSMWWVGMREGSRITLFLKETIEFYSLEDNPNPNQAVTRDSHKSHFYVTI